MRAWQVRTGDRPPSAPITDEGDLRKAIAGRLSQFDDPFTLHPWGKPEGPPRKRSDAVDRAFAQSTHAQTGFVLGVRNSKGKGILIRVLDIVVPASATDANEKVDRWFVMMRSRFSPGLLNLGATVCKSIGSTSTPSQHNPWSELSAPQAKAQAFSSAGVSDRGNAADLSHSGGRAVMKRMWSATLDARVELEVQNVIHWPLGEPYPLIWNPARGIHRYVIPRGGSTHDNHVHADFAPSRPYGASHIAC